MFQQKRGSKYNNKTSVYNGIAYHSMKERDFAQTLDTLKKATDPRQRVVNWERQVKLPLTVNGHFIANYYMDFKVKYAGGHEEFIEVKGMEMDLWK